MTELNEKATKVFALKYSARKTKTWKENCQNNADFISQGELPYNPSEEQRQKISEKFYNYLLNLYFLAGGRIIANAGTGIKNLANCFVLGIQDSRDSIYNTLHDAAEVFADGGGCGYNFSNIREEGAEIKTTGGKASGALSFMSLFDQTGEVISQASRRGAQMGILNIDHPDIEKFIDFKSTLNTRNERLIEEYERNLTQVDGQIKETKYGKVLEKTLLDDQLTHFNISVMLSDKFMKAIENDEDWNLVSPSTKNVVKTVKAKYLLKKMADRAWTSGDPGQLFIDRINEDNLVKYIGLISATNPCGEVPLLEGESCILSSINLHSVYDKNKKEINYDLLKDIVVTMTIFLDDVTEMSEAPIEYINKMTKGLRRLGGGVMGWSDLLVELNIPYDSPKALELAEYLSWFINFHSWETSFKLAKIRGAFPFYDKDKVDMHIVKKVLYDNPYMKSDILENELMEIGVRNVSVTSLAPTGSIAIIGGVNSGIEPPFALAYIRNITEGVGNIAKDKIFETNPSLENKLKEFNYNEKESKEIIEYAAENGTLNKCPYVSKEFQDLFKTANEIHWKDHVNMQSAWQKYTSNAISKTINIPENSTKKDIYDIYFYMWKKGLKGGTIYRNNSKSFQILEKPSEN